MTVNSSATSIILILFAFSDNISAENSKLPADFSIQLIQLLECMSRSGMEVLKVGQAGRSDTFGLQGSKITIMN